MSPLGSPPNATISPVSAMLCAKINCTPWHPPLLGDRVAVRNPIHLVPREDGRVEAIDVNESADGRTNLRTDRASTEPSFPWHAEETFSRTATRTRKDTIQLFVAKQRLGLPP